MEPLSELKYSLKNSRVEAVGENTFGVRLGKGDWPALITYADEHRLELVPSYGRKAGTIIVTPDSEITGTFIVNAEDMYIEAPATAPLAEVNAAAGSRAGLWLPFVAGTDEAPVGEVLAVYPPNAVAPIYGELPRLVLGVEALLCNGESVRLGRRTVKGVTGFDLAKLFIGSDSSYGLLTRVRFRLWPRPGERVVWTASGEPANGWETRARLLRSVPFKCEGRPAVYAEGSPETVQALKTGLEEGLKTAWYERARGDEALELLRRSFREAGPDTPKGPALNTFPALSLKRPLGKGRE